jgi:hypothetical protein
MRFPLRFNVKTITIIAVLFVFLVPVVPTTVSVWFLLPTRNECFLILPSTEPRQVFASISYVLVGFVLTRTGTVHDGAFGLVYVPNNGWYSVQFPPLGFESIACL